MEQHPGAAHLDALQLLQRDFRAAVRREQSASVADGSKDSGKIKRENITHGGQMGPNWEGFWWGWFDLAFDRLQAELEQFAMSGRPLLLSVGLRRLKTAASATGRRANQTQGPRPKRKTSIPKQVTCNSCRDSAPQAQTQGCPFSTFLLPTRVRILLTLKPHHCFPRRGRMPSSLSFRAILSKPILCRLSACIRSMTAISPG